MADFGAAPSVGATKPAPTLDCNATASEKSDEGAWCAGANGAANEDDEVVVAEPRCGN